MTKIRARQALVLVCMVWFLSSFHAMSFSPSKISGWRRFMLKKLFLPMTLLSLDSFLSFFFILHRRFDYSEI